MMRVYINGARRRKPWKLTPIRTGSWYHVAVVQPKKSGGA